MNTAIRNRLACALAVAIGIVWLAFGWKEALLCAVLAVLGYWGVIGTEPILEGLEKLWLKAPKWLQANWNPLEWDQVYLPPWEVVVTLLAFLVAFLIWEPSTNTADAKFVRQIDVHEQLRIQNSLIHRLEAATCVNPASDVENLPGMYALCQEIGRFNKTTRMVLNLSPRLTKTLLAKPETGVTILAYLGPAPVLEPIAAKACDAF